MSINPRYTGAVRHILTAIGFYLANRGYVEESGVETLVGAIMTIGGLIWSAMAPEKKGSGAKPVIKKEP